MILENLMLKLSNILAATTLTMAMALSACSETTAWSQSENVSTETTVAENNPETALADEGSSLEQANTNDFNVTTNVDPNQIFGGVIQVQYRGNGTTVLTDVIVNRGDCEVLIVGRVPVKLEFGQVMAFPTECNFNNVLEVEVNTETSYYTYDFTN